ncbi:MAG: penicillin-binding protein 2 [Planctomycetaceae bacterium]|nr:penicillin-binding protein 2 [Planctomycetaceae bacterium]
MTLAENRLGLRRINLLSTGVVLGWLILAGRLIQVQGTQRDVLAASVTRQSTFQEPIHARPGEILDRNGHVLAMTISRESLFAVPSAIDDPWDFAWKISRTLKLNADTVYRSLTEDPDRHFVWIRRRLTEEQAEAVRGIQLPDGTIGFRSEYQRQYPQGAFAAHVLGIRDIDNIGRGGLEQSLDSLIRGEDGVRVLTRDARGVVIEIAAEQSRPPQHGRTVISTLDLIMQVETERRLDDLVKQWDPQGACAIVMDPSNGDVLAMASRPAFDPNHLTELPEEAWKNLAVSAVFEPGSTFKPMIVAWALQNHSLRQDEMIDCHLGAYRMGRRVLHDHHPYGELSVEDVLVKSSNIGMAKIAERMGLEELYRATVSFGFGRRTGIELPGEATGLLRPLARWDEYSMGSVPMGQELAVTPLQMITAHAALANGGRLVRPHVLASDRDRELIPSPLFTVNAIEATASVESVLLDSEVAQWVVSGPMKQVVERGTGKSAQIPGRSVFGKTGTAQKFDPETGTYSDDGWVVSFLCGSPAEAPEVLVLVVVDQPRKGNSHYGGTVAAPVAAQILDFAEARIRMTQSSLLEAPQFETTQHETPRRAERSLQ